MAKENKKYLQIILGIIVIVLIVGVLTLININSIKSPTGKADETPEPTGSATPGQACYRINNMEGVSLREKARICGETAGCSWSGGQDQKCYYAGDNPTPGP